MNGLLAIALSNLLVATVIAVPALLAGRLSRPALAHGLWLLFFVKLLTPPLFPIPIAWSLAASEEALNEAQTPPSLEEELPQPVFTGWSDGAEPVTPEIKADVAGIFNQALVAAPTEPPANVAAEPVEFPWMEAAVGLWLTG